MKALKEILLGLYLVSTVAMAGQDDVIARLAIDNASVKPDQAMAMVSEKYSGKLSEFSLDENEVDDSLVYEITVIDPKEGVKIEVNVDPETGGVTEVERESIRSWYSKSGEFDKEKYKKLFEGTTLQSAVAEAKKIAPGVLMEAELEHEKGLVFFETELLTGKGVQKIIVDMSTGKPIPVATREINHS